MRILRRRIDRSRLRMRHAFTIVELMITITIIAGVTALALPRVREALKSNVLASAANTVDGALEFARATAIASGRPHGVLIERLSNDLAPGKNNFHLSEASNLARTNVSRRISFVQMPPSYEIGKSVYPFDLGLCPPATVRPPLRFFVPRADAPLLFAAADADAPGHLAARRLIDAGSLIRLEAPRGGDVRVSQITRLIEVGSTGVYANFQAAVAGLSCTTVTLPGSDVALLEGVVIETDDLNLVGQAFGSYSRPEGSLDAFNDAYIALNGSIELKAIKAAIPPLNLPGRAAIDLSVSGWRQRPDAFGVQGIMFNDSAAGGSAVGDYSVATGEQTLRDVMIMFSSDGQIDSLQLDVFDSSTGRFVWTTLPVPESICLMVGTSDAVLDNVYDNARAPEPFSGEDLTNYPAPPVPPTSTDYIGLSDDPVESLRQTPNLDNSDNQWIVINSFSGNVQSYPVAAQPDEQWFSDNFSDGSLPFAIPVEQAARLRIRAARRLAFSGAR